MLQDDENINKAEEYFLEAIRLGKMANATPKNIAAFYNNLGGYYGRKGMFNKALSMFLEAKNIHEETNFAYGKSMVYGNLAMLYMEMCQCSKSIEYARRENKIEDYLNSLGILYKLLVYMKDISLDEEVYGILLQFAERGNINALDAIFYV